LRKKERQIDSFYRIIIGVLSLGSHNLLVIKEEGEGGINEVLMLHRASTIMGF
jgi:hypothetical protein